MKREILFRAKRIDNGEWAEGFIYEHGTPLVCFKEDESIKETPKCYICRAGFADWGLPRPVDFIEINPDTICEFTGCLDKNGEKIWENDIVECTNVNPKRCYGYTQITGVVKYCAGFYINLIHVSEDYMNYDMYLTSQAFRKRLGSSIK